MKKTKKRPYEAPVLVEYGQLDQLTLGPGGNLPDVDPQGDAGPGGCPDPGGGVVACLIASASTYLVP